MHAIPHWQTFLEDYDRLTLANMSVHHLDVLRFLFGDPDEITTADAQGPAHHVRAHGRHHRLDAALPSAACWPCRWRTSGPARARRAIDGRPAHQLAGRGHRRRRQGHDRLADRRGLDADLCLDEDHRRQVGDADLGHDVVPARLHRRDGAAAARRRRPAPSRRSRSPTTSRPWRWSRPATARSTKAAPSSSPKSRSD